MIKRIIVGLDPSEDCKKAIELACLRGMLSEGTVVGVGVVDMPGIDRAARGGGRGASYYAKKSRETHVREAEAKVQTLLAEFRAECERLGVTHETEHHAGDPVDVLTDVAQGADVLVIGARSDFHFETVPEPGATLQKLLERHVCPVMAVPRDLVLPPGSIVFPFDGSAEASRAMRSFIMITDGLPIEKRVTLLRIDADPQAGLAALERPAQYLLAHGCEVERVVRPGTPAEAVLEFVREQKAPIVVIGASGRGRVARFLFGSVTRALVAAGDFPVFISA